MPTPPRAEALATLEAGQDELDALFGQLTDTELSQPGTVGRSDWAAKDLLGHIAFWEELALIRDHGRLACGTAASCRRHLRSSRY